MNAVGGVEAAITKLRLRYMLLREAQENDTDDIGWEMWEEEAYAVFEAVKNLVKSVDESPSATSCSCTPTSTCGERRNA